MSALRNEACIIIALFCSLPITLVENVSHVPTDAERARAAEAQHGFDACAPQMRKNLAGSGFDGLGRGSGALAQLAATLACEIVIATSRRSDLRLL